MKKTLIILTVLILATWLLIMPGLVGAFLKHWLPDWLAEAMPQAQTEFSTGWFHSSLALTDSGLSAQLTGRHFPALRPGWLHLTGRIEAPEWAEVMQVTGFMHLNGRTRVQLLANQVDLAGEPRIQTSQARFRLEQQPGGDSQFVLASEDLHLGNTAGSSLDASRLNGTINWDRITDQQRGLTLALSLVDKPADGHERPSNLRLLAAPIDREALSELLDGYEQLRLARPDTLDEQFALLTLAGAWQQMTAAGLVIHLETLSLSGKVELKGEWTTARGLPRINGSGDTETLMGWLGLVIGLSRNLSPDQAEQEARAWLESLVDRQWLRVDRSGFVFDYPPESESESAPLPLPP